MTFKVKEEIVKTKKIAIVGGGANGVSVCNEIIDQIAETKNPESYEISLYEKTGFYGTGLAYGTSNDAHILNMPACRMSAVASNSHHFADWLSKEHESKQHPYFKTKSGPKDYVPRKVFGIYLIDIFTDALRKAEFYGIKVNVFNEQVLEIKENSEVVEITTNDWTEVYHNVILCLGNHPPTNWTELKSTYGYFSHAWPANVIIENIPKEADVCILGSSLTAVDTFITLQENGHSGSITFFSRHGLLPKVRVLNSPYQLTHLKPKKILSLTNGGRNKLCLERIASLFIAEFQSSGVKIPLLSEILSQSSKPVFEVLEHDIELAENGQLQYFSVLKAIDNVVGILWNGLCDDDKKRFDSQYKALWNAYVYPMPLQNARKLLKAMKDGQLKVKRGFKGIKFCHEKQVFELKYEDFDNSSNTNVHEIKYVINATGQGLDIKKLDNPVIQNALKTGTITAHRFGGIDVDFKSGAVRKSCGCYSEKIYALGSLTRGVHFYTNSINENAKCGKRSVTEIISKTEATFR